MGLRTREGRSGDRLKTSAKNPISARKRVKRKSCQLSILCQ
ncbi:MULTISPECIES: hypothetical protein [unclassified Microcoleus]|nr:MULTISPECIES: hypothetical protein [unclassified Microcoleus]